MQRRFSKLPRLLLALILGLLACSPAASEPMNLGTNLYDLRYWAPVWPFVDAFKSSHPWISGDDETWDDGRPVAVDEHGWVTRLAPGQIVRTLLFWDLPPGHYPGGHYTVLYRGRGKLEYRKGARRIAAASAPGRDVVAVDATKGGILMQIRATNPADPLRDIRVLLPGGRCSAEPARYCDASTPCGTGTCRPFEESHAEQPFHPQFIASLAPYRVLRFMDWMRTNDSPAVRWSDRPKPSDARWSVKGAPLEVMLDLATATGTEPWFTISHRASDSYARRFAKALAEKLPPGRRVWIERSNEVWNSQFEQAREAVRLGEAQGLGEGHLAGLRYHAKRSSELFAIFRAAFGGDRRRMRAVLGAQAVNAWSVEQMLAFGDTASQTDVVAIAPYFGYRLGLPDEKQRVAAMSLDELFAELRSRDLPAVEVAVRAQKEVAARHDLELVAYEGGQHLVAHPSHHDHAGIAALFDDANRDARMAALYRDYLAAMERGGITSFMHFTHTGRYDKWGRWGSLEHLGQAVNRAPKYRALRDYAAEPKGPQTPQTPGAPSLPEGS